MSHTWIYQHISQDKIADGELYNYMRYDNYSKGYKDYKGTIMNRVSIELYQSIVNELDRLGDYEIDLIVG